MSLVEREVAVKATQVQKRFTSLHFKLSSDSPSKLADACLNFFRFDLEVNELKRSNYQLKTQIEAILQTKK